MYVKLPDGDLNPGSSPSIPQELILIKLPSRQGMQWSYVVIVVVVVIVIITIINYEREREREREKFSISSFCKSLVAHNKIGIQ